MRRRPGKEHRAPNPSPAGRPAPSRAGLRRPQTEVARAIGSRGIIAAVGLVVAAVLVGLWFGWLPSPWHTGRDNPADLAATLKRAAELETAGRFTESAPLFRQVVDRTLSGRANLRRAYAAVLNNAAIEVHDRNGVQVYGARSTVQRIEMAHESLRQIQIALTETSDPIERAQLLDDAGRTEAWWGLSWDALQTFNAAAQLDPRSVDIRNHARACAARMLTGAAPGR